MAKTEKGRSLRRQVDPLRIVGTEGHQRALGNSPNRTSTVLTSWLTLAFTQTLVEIGTFIFFCVVRPVFTAVVAGRTEDDPELSAL